MTGTTPKPHPLDCKRYTSNGWMQVAYIDNLLIISGTGTINELQLCKQDREIWSYHKNKHGGIQEVQIAMLPLDIVWSLDWSAVRRF